MDEDSGTESMTNESQLILFRKQIRYDETSPFYRAPGNDDFPASNDYGDDTYSETHYVGCGYHDDMPTTNYDEANLIGTRCACDLECRGVASFRYRRFDSSLPTDNTIKRNLLIPRCLVDKLDLVNTIKLVDIRVRRVIKEKD